MLLTVSIDVTKLIVQVKETVEASSDCGDGAVAGQNAVVKLQVRGRTLEVEQFGFFNKWHGAPFEKFKAAGLSRSLWKYRSTFH